METGVPMQIIASHGPVVLSRIQAHRRGGKLWIQSSWLPFPKTRMAGNSLHSGKKIPKRTRVGSWAKTRQARLYETSVWILPRLKRLTN